MTADTLLMLMLMRSMMLIGLLKLMLMLKPMYSMMLIDADTLLILVLMCSTTLIQMLMRLRDSMMLI
ncbi:MAG: hypothetical protein ACLT8H_06975 [Streptococcus parasanguinis]